MFWRMIVSIVALSSILFLLGCGHRDVTLDPAYHFAHMAGSRWKLKVPVAISRLPDGTLWGYGCSASYASAFVTGTADVHAFGTDTIVDILPLGTEIQFDRLEWKGGEVGRYTIWISVHSGKHTGKKLLAPQLDLFLDNQFLEPGKSRVLNWVVNPDKLEKP